MWVGWWCREPVAVVPAAAGRDHDGRGPSRLARLKRCAGGAGVVGRRSDAAGWNVRAGRGVTSTRIDHGLAITCLSPGRSALGRSTAVSVAVRPRPRVVAVRLQASWSPWRGYDVSGGGPGPLERAGGAGSGVGPAIPRRRSRRTRLGAGRRRPAADRGTAPPRCVCPRRCRVDGSAASRSPERQALMACWSLLSLLMVILRGLACSATGILNVSTPPS